MVTPRGESRLRPGPLHGGECSLPTVIQLHFEEGNSVTEFQLFEGSAAAPQWADIDVVSMGDFSDF